MNWRHRAALELFAQTDGALRFHRTPGVGEKTWKALLEKGWIVERPDLRMTNEKTWWQIPHALTAAGRAALAVVVVK